MLDSKEALVVVEFLSITIIIWQIITEVSYVVVCAVPYYLIICRPDMKRMWASLDFDEDVAIFRHHVGFTRTPLLTGKMQTIPTLSKQFTSGNEEDEIEY